MSAIDSYLRQGIGTTIGVFTGSGIHALTVWGCEYGVTTSDYLGIYYTDSDDNNALRYSTVAFDEAQSGHEDRSARAS